MLIEVVGWVGSLLLVTAYGLNSFKKIQAGSVLFNGMNLVAGILLIMYSYFKEASANIFINSVWVIIALVAILKPTRK